MACSENCKHNLLLIISILIFIIFISGAESEDAEQQSIIIP